MKKNVLCAAALIMALACALVITGCPDPTKDDGGGNLSLEGTWTHTGSDSAAYKVVAAGSNYTIYRNNLLFETGTFTTTSSSITFTSTATYHADPGSGNLDDPQQTGTVTFGASLSGTTLTLSGGTGSAVVFNGDWAKQ